MNGQPGSRVIVGAALALLAVGCTVGPSVETFRPARSGAGVAVRLQVDAAPTWEVRGELLAVEQDAFLIVVYEVEGGPWPPTPTHYLARISTASTVRATLDQVGTRTKDRRGVFRPDFLERARLLSRYPQGVSDELLERLLEAYDQAEPAVHPPREGGPGAGPSASAPRHGHPHADAAHPGMEAFLRAARDGSRRYRDASAALAEGYRPMGADAPAMGRHWVNARHLMTGTIEAERPTFLSYVSVGGRETLVGVGYAVSAGRLAEASAAVPAPPEAWHIHAGRLSDESHKPDHDGGSSGAMAGVAVLHAWVWAPNPAGPLTPDNWSLPWVRLGLTPPPDAPVGASKALSLCTAEGAEYFAAQRQRFGGSSPGADTELALAALTATRGEAVTRCRALAGRGPEPAEVAWLAEAWLGLERLGF